MEWTRWFRKLVLLSLVVLFLMSAVSTTTASRPQSDPSTGRPYGASAQPISVMPYNSLAMVISEDRWSDVRAKPCSPTIRFSVLTGTRVRVAEPMFACGDVWYRVEFANGAQGWLPWYMLKYLGR